MSKRSTKQPLSERDRLIVRPERPLPAPEDPEKPKTEDVDPKPANPDGQASDPRRFGDEYTA
ncbi:MAG: hypothetical protein FJ271_20535 [Planctomycetes bacterium]|nr:hypothetical protein [Planctomycetota bacterium]